MNKEEVIENVICALLILAIAGLGIGFVLFS